MKIKSVEARWVHIPIPPERQHVSDFGRTLSFDGTLVRIETECGLVGWGEAKAQVGGMAQNQALTCMINEEFAPLLKGEDPRDITRLWETLYSGTRGHYALREGRVFPVLGRRGITISAISGVDCALWDILGKSLGQPVCACSAAAAPKNCRPMPRAAGPERTRSASSSWAMSRPAGSARSRCASASSTATRAIRPPG
jgi:L-alanine-DL-glutamate epimerase-like enolase superfamily enzyme